MIKRYEENKGILVAKIYNIFGEYIFKVNDGRRTISVKVGKELFHMYQLNAKLTVGHIGKKLINIRAGIISSDGEEQI